MLLIYSFHFMSAFYKDCRLSLQCAITGFLNFTFSQKVPSVLLTLLIRCQEEYPARKKLSD